MKIEAYGLYRHALPTHGMFFMILVYVSTAMYLAIEPQNLCFWERIIYMRIVTGRPEKRKLVPMKDNLKMTRRQFRCSGYFFVSKERGTRGQHRIPESDLLHVVCRRFPRIKIVTSEIEKGLNQEFCVLPGIGEFEYDTNESYYEYFVMITCKRFRLHCINNNLKCSFNSFGSHTLADQIVDSNDMLHFVGYSLHF